MRDHRGAVEYDLRSRLNIGLRDIPGRVTLPELARMVMILAGDPSTQTCAAISGWPHPISYETILLADLYDFHNLRLWGEAGGKGRKPKPHPIRPVQPVDKNTRRYGDAGGRTPAQIVDILRSLGHNL